MVIKLERVLKTRGAVSPVRMTENSSPSEVQAHLLLLLLHT